VKEHAYFNGVNWDDVYHLRLKPPYFPCGDSISRDFISSLSFQFISTISSFLSRNMSQSDLLVLLRSSFSSSASMPAVSITKEEILLDLEKCGDKGLPYVKNLQKRIKGIINQLLEKELSSKGIFANSNISCRPIHDTVPGRKDNVVSAIPRTPPIRTYPGQTDCQRLYRSTPRSDGTSKPTRRS
jgi:hypothetical protein